MAKKETAVAVVEAQETALATIPQDLLDAQGAGTENIKASDVRPPRLQICQVGSAQIKKSNPKYIEGIQAGDLFNSLSGEKYEKPLKFFVIQRLPSTYRQFDRNELGKVLDYDIPEGDPRTIPTTVNGKWTKPVATQFDSYLVMLPDTFEIVTLSFKSTGLKAARQLDSMLKIPLKIGATLVPRPPAWARSFTLDSAITSGKGNEWSTPVIGNAGVTPEDMRVAAASLYAQYKTIAVVVEHDENDAVSEAPDSDSIPF